MYDNIINVMEVFESKFGRYQDINRNRGIKREYVCAVTQNLFDVFYIGWVEGAEYVRQKAAEEGI